MECRETDFLDGILMEYLVLGGFHGRNFHIHDSVHDSTKYLNIPIYQDKFFRNLHDISHINITLYVKRIEKNRGFIPQNFKISSISTLWNPPNTIFDFFFNFSRKIECQLIEESNNIFFTLQITSDDQQQ